MKEKFSYVIDSNGLLISDNVISFGKRNNLERRIYLFVNKNEKGIVFTDLTDFMKIDEYTPYEEHFVTKKDLVHTVDWNSSINYLKRYVRLNTSDGVIIAKTFFVLRDVMNDILKRIKESRDDENIEINLKNY